MAKKKGRPPKTPSSSAKKPQDTNNDHEAPKENTQQGLVQLDDDDLDTLDSLSPTKAMALLKNLDALRGKVVERFGKEINDGEGQEGTKDKVIETEKTNPLSPGACHGASPSNPGATQRQNSSCRRLVKKQWVVKKNPESEAEEVPKVAPELNNITAMVQDNVEKEVQSKEETFVAETQHAEGDKGSEAGDEKSSDSMPDLDEIPWTVKTRNKGRKEMKGKDSGKIVASKANG
ncbi:hypothetical protein RIF29_29645 [Crotalaria pallida]|uniref:Uncharacterized protein n=1 Tax=Crotalaria pallida TaxID=3830 RepID=A0AAN9HW29_CROPI